MQRNPDEFVSWEEEEPPCAFCDGTGYRDQDPDEGWCPECRPPSVPTGRVRLRSAGRPAGADDPAATARAATADERDGKGRDTAVAPRRAA